MSTQTTTTPTRTVTILAFRVGRAPAVEQLADGLEAIQAFVGGLFQAVPFTADACGRAMLDMCCNEEGKLEGLAANRRFGAADTIHGDFYVSKTDSNGESASLTPEDVAIATAYFHGTEVR
jgi:hypothetical protein